MNLRAHFLPRDQIALAIETMVAVLDLLDGNPDSELNGDESENDGDSLDTAWVEWHTMRGSQKRGPNIVAADENDELDDEDCDGFENEPAFDARTLSRLNRRFADGPGCIVSDSDYDAGDL